MSDQPHFRKNDRIYWKGLGLWYQDTVEKGTIQSTTRKDDIRAYVLWDGKAETVLVWRGSVAKIPRPTPTQRVVLMAAYRRGGEHPAQASPGTLGAMRRDGMLDERNFLTQIGFVLGREEHEAAS